MRRGGGRARLARLAAGDPATIGPYRILARIGAGGMGTVFAAAPPAGDTGYTAVKVVHPEFAADPEFRVRFAREVESVSRVRGRFVPAFRGAAPDAEVPWLATEYVPGPTLHDHVREHGPLGGGALLGLAAGLAAALACVHACGVVHRDFKPGNVLLAADGPKVVDFGIARAAEATAITRTGAVVGTAGWMSPEQYRGQEPTERSDMFAWGALVAYAATGREPFGSGGTDVLAYRVLREPPDLGALDGPLRGLVESALAKDPAARPDARAALDAVLGVWREGAGPDALADLLAAEWPIREVRPPKPPLRRGPVAAAFGGTAAAAALAVAAATVYAAGPPGQEQQQGAGQAQGPGQAQGQQQTPADQGQSGAAAPSASENPAELPLEAVAEVRVGSIAADTEIEEGGSAADFTTLGGEGLGDLQAVFNAVESSGSAVEFTVNMRTSTGENAGMVLSEENFWILAGGEEFRPERSDLGFPENAQDMQYLERNEYTLSFPDAPPTGLLVYQSPEVGSTDTVALPPIGACYDAAGGGFSVEYRTCV